MFRSQRSISSVWRETGQTFSTQEPAALEWAETLTLISEMHAPVEIYRDIAAHFTEKEMVDLTIAIA
jgi:alkylhydroperoxidase family enzyme